MTNADPINGNHPYPRTQSGSRLRPRLQSERLRLQPESLSPRRILKTTDTVDGMWTYALDLTRAVAEYGVE
jgi:hypothetical protein